MPGNDAPVIKIRNQFHIRDGEEGAATNHPRDPAGECLGIFGVLDEFRASSRDRIARIPAKHL
jgi:hypothetical protein